MNEPIIPDLRKNIIKIIVCVTRFIRLSHPHAVVHFQSFRVINIVLL